MLELVNASRTQNGLTPVIWDEFSASVGQAHAQEMSSFKYMSHWNLQGRGPDVRFSLAGGVDPVQENVYQLWQLFDDGSAIPIHDWPALIRQAHEAWMNSPGHRANILNPDHTHMGIGIDYDAKTGYAGLAQEFTNHYLELQTVDRKVAIGDTLLLTGQMLVGVDKLVVNIAYEPFPSPISIEMLRLTDTYSSPAKTYTVISVDVRNDGAFSKLVTLDQPGVAGLYHVRIWLNTDREDVLAGDVVIQVD